MAADSLSSFIPIPNSDYVSNDDESTYCTKRVHEYDESLPKLDAFLLKTSGDPPSPPEKKRYVIYTPLKVKQWFEEILSGDIRLMNIGGVGIGMDQCCPLRCDLCLVELDPEEQRPNFKICVRAEGEGGDINVCVGCFENKSLKPYEPSDPSRYRGDKEYCDKVNKQGLRDHKRREDLMRQYLDGERGWISQDIPKVQTCFWCYASSLVVSGVWRELQKTEEDPEGTSMCPDCISFLGSHKSQKTAKVCQGLVCRTDDRKREPAKDNSCWSLFRRIEATDYVGFCDECKEAALSAPTHEILPEQTFGSLMEWVPILEDENLHTLLYNMAQGSKRYHNVAVMTYDDHGRAGVHFIPGTLEDALKEFAELQERYEKKYPKGEEETWKAHYSSPICRMATIRGKEVQFG